MKLTGVIGPSYTLQSKNAASERCLGWYPERLESDQGTNTWILQPVPGIFPFCAMPGQQGRGCFAQDGRAWAVVDDGLYEVFKRGQSGAVIRRGTVAFDGTPVTFASAADESTGALPWNNQMLLPSAGGLSLYNLVTNVLTDISAVTDAPVPAAMCGYTDGYAIVLLRVTGNFQISGFVPNIAAVVPDFSRWNSLDAEQVGFNSDKVLSMVIDHREVWLFGSTRSGVWRNVGGAGNPFQPIGGAVLEQGIIAPFSACRFDNTIAWLGGSAESGAGRAFRANGYTPQRISTHAVETIWQSYPRIDDAVGWRYDEDGHEFYMLDFPSGETSWGYDAASGMWHERAVWNPDYTRFEPQIPRFHMYAFGTHLVQDRQSGALYEQSRGLTAYTVLHPTP